MIINVGAAHLILALSFLACSALIGCAHLDPSYERMAHGGYSVVAYHCLHADGDDAGKAFFDKDKGLAMMILSMGIELTGRALLVAPLILAPLLSPPFKDSCGQTNPINSHHLTPSFGDHGPHDVGVGIQ
jgi:hypothetical protein